MGFTYLVPASWTWRVLPLHYNLASRWRGRGGGCSMGELISLLLCFQTWRATFLHSAKACSAWEGFPPALPRAQTSVAESLESPGWISLDFHHQPPTFRGLLPFTWHYMFQGSFSFVALPVGKHSQWVKSLSVAGAASHSNPSPDCHKLIKISAHFSF